jgi:hypothetical protein
MIPADKILENQYTSGNEYFVISTGKYYQGYYCIVLNTKFYTGKTYTNQSEELTNIVPAQQQPPLTSLPPQGNSIRYFIKKINQFPIIIKEINEQTYNNYKNNPFYQSIAVKLPASDFKIDTKELDQANKQMPGLKAFLLG